MSSTPHDPPVVDNVSGFTYADIQAAYYTEPGTMLDFKNALKSIKPAQATAIDQLFSSMGIEKIIIAGLFALLFFSCTKKYAGCPKEGYEYVNSSLHCWYSPPFDSIPIGSSLTLEASVPKTFVDETTNTTVTNTSPLIRGPLGVVMIYPIYQAAVDSFELTAQIGKVTKDTAQFSEGILKGFRTIQWDDNTIDSFKMKITIRALAKGTYAFALKQQSAKDKDCALYKYFLSPGDANQHLNYWMDAFGSVSGQVNFFTYCFKVY